MGPPWALPQLQTRLHHQYFSGAAVEKTTFVRGSGFVATFFLGIKFSVHFRPIKGNTVLNVYVGFFIVFWLTSCSLLIFRAKPLNGQHSAYAWAIWQKYNITVFHRLDHSAQSFHGSFSCSFFFASYLTAQPKEFPCCKKIQPYSIIKHANFIFAKYIYIYFFFVQVLENPNRFHSNVKFFLWISSSMLFMPLHYQVENVQHAVLSILGLGCERERVEEI